MMHARRFRFSGLLFAALCFWGCGLAAAQDGDSPKVESDQRRDTLRGVERALEKSSFEQRRLTHEIEILLNDTQKMRASLIDLAKKVQQAEERLGVAEAKLADVSGRAESLRRSLASRERVTAEVLAAMQRIGRKPPPALLVSPEDALQAIRAAILLGAVLPDMRDEMMILVADLKTLVELRRQAAEAAGRVKSDRDQLAGERERLAALVEARQSQTKSSQAQLESETRKIADLSREAKSLKELISRTENEIVGAAKASELARRAPAPARSAQELAALRPEAFKDAARLQPRLAMQDAKGLISLPVSGNIVRNFGASDGLGGTERGLTIESAKDALVTNPIDGWVLFAGPYRGYGHLLIMNAGNGYHIVLAGMERLNVEIGQFVLAGEPVGTLGLSPAIQPGGGFAGGGLTGEGLGSLRPALYVEFRKDGSPVDPSPWWTNQSAEKARG